MMELYYEHMIQHYEEIRLHRIDQENNRVTDLSYKMKFIKHVLDGDIELIKVKEEIISAKMQEYEIPYEYYEKSKSRDFSIESLQKYEKQIKEAKAKLNTSEKTTANKIWLDKLDILRLELQKRY